MQDASRSSKTAAPAASPADHLPRNAPGLYCVALEPLGRNEIGPVIDETRLGDPGRTRDRRRVSFASLAGKLGTKRGVPVPRVSGDALRRRTEAGPCDCGAG